MKFKSNCFLRLTVVIVISILFISCNDKTELSEEVTSKKTDNPEISINQGATKYGNPDQNLIREETENNFRSLRPQNEKSYNPLQPSHSADSGNDKTGY